MAKKACIPLLVVSVLCVLSGHVTCDENLRRGLFVTVLQEPQVLASRSEIDALVTFAKKAGVKELFVQAYFAGKSWFPSTTADETPYRSCLAAVGEDPLALLIAKAHAEGIEAYAWLNMLSLGSNSGAPILKRYGTGVLTRNSRKKFTLNHYRIDGQFFLEPGDMRVRADLLKIVEEILAAYPELDGLLFDYIRYPDVKPAYGRTKANMERFKNATGGAAVDEKSPAWQEWKRGQVTELLALLAARSRLLHPGITVGATGCMPYQRAYFEAFQDWPSWLERGIVDRVTAMNYSPDPEAFARWAAAAKAKTADFGKVDIGIGAYKLALSPGTFEREFLFCSGCGAGGTAVFHYGSLVQAPQLKDILAGSGRRGAH